NTPTTAPTPTPPHWIRTRYPALWAAPTVGGAILMVGSGTSTAQGNCLMWAFPRFGDVGLTQSNGWTVGFQGAGQNPRGDAVAVAGNARMTGTVTWHSNYESQVRFTIAWRNGPTGYYVGNVNSRGFATGKTGTATWQSYTDFQCASG
uniref:hypothetical protein n=1 Tax=Nocardia brasiliensis TaxID=37326 RepID=UPI002457CACA